MCRLKVIAASCLLLLPLSPPLAWPRSGDACPNPSAGHVIDVPSLGGRSLSRAQLKWCMQQARAINAFLKRAAQQKLDLTQLRTLVELKRRAEAASVNDAKGRFQSALRASRLDADALVRAGETLDTMETYDIACAGRLYEKREEAAVQKELRLSDNPMRLVPYSATARAPETEDRLRSGRPALTREEQATADAYHRYLIHQIVEHMRTAERPWPRGRVRVRLRLAPSGALHVAQHYGGQRG